MGILENFEKKLDRMVNGAFAKAFKSEVQPVEIAAGLQRELDDRATIVSRARTVVPNSFVVELATGDYRRLTAFEETVNEELAGLVQEYAEQQRYVFVGTADVALAEDPALGTGVFRVRSEVRPGKVRQPQAAAARPEGEPYIEMDGISYPLRSVTQLGRGADVDIRIDDPGVSRHHAEITLGSDVSLRDLGSTNGTIVNGRVVARALLSDGATIQMGTTTLTYRAR